MTSVSVRNCTSNDIPHIRDIYNYYVLKDGDLVTFEEEPVSEDLMLRRLESKVADGFPFIVAVDCNDRVLGYAYGGHYKERSAYRFSVEDSIYIHPDCQGRGVGTTLLKELLHRFKLMGVKQVVAVLGVKEDNPGSYALHSRFGFESVGVYKNIGFKHGKWVDRLHMQCCLDDSIGSDNG